MLSQNISSIFTLWLKVPHKAAVTMHNNHIEAQWCATATQLGHIVRKTNHLHHVSVP